jgi:hypothetical protein
VSIEDIPDSIGALRELRRLSRYLFGGDYRAEIALAIAGAPQVCKVDLKRALLRRSTPDPPGETSINDEYDRLVALGFLSLPDVPVRSGRRFATPSETAYWDLCRELRDRAEASISQGVDLSSESSPD